MDNATARRRVTPEGLLLGFLGVVGFSFSLPATRVAVEDLDPWFVAFGRAAVAAALATAYLLAVRAPRPTRPQVTRLVVVAGGVVVGFPLCTSIALQGSTAGHAAVVIALLPAATAVAAVLRAGERPSRAFWLAAAAGAVSVLAFAFAQGTGGFETDDLLLLLAVATCALGYAEGGALSRELGGARTICWALIVSAPLTVAITAATLDTTAGAAQWLSFAYVSVISMFLGFFAWYAGLARGGVAKIGQVQLSQPVMTMGWAALVLGEHIGPATIGTALVVLACVVATQRAKDGDARGVVATPRTRA